MCQSQDLPSSKLPGNVTHKSLRLLQVNQFVMGWTNCPRQVGVAVVVTVAVVAAVVVVVVAVAV